LNKVWGVGEGFLMGTYEAKLRSPLSLYSKQKGVFLYSKQKGVFLNSKFVQKNI
jgi:hypothetical protein